MFTIEPMIPVLHAEIVIMIDPAAGGPHSDYSLVSIQRIRGNVTIVGMESINTKEPAKQFALVEEHISKLRQNVYRTRSPVKIFVERNLGFEAEHHRRALSHIEGVTFYEDVKAGRVGVLTTESVKYCAMELVNIMLREKRICICRFMHSRDIKAMKIRMREQLEIYSFQYKEAINTFQKSRQALSGKVGGCKDDLAICLQLACYFTSVGILEKTSHEID
jgi:hypothetical protein